MSAAFRRLKRLPIDALLALATATTVLIVYFATIYPGLTPIGDASKFAFVGKVLGVPHAPGYPLYVMVSHLFSYLPIGTLAYRMNVLSAVLGAVAAALNYLVARQLGVRALIAMPCALALAFGTSFWSQALYPKGYTLNAALVSAGTLMLVRWSGTRRTMTFYAAAGLFALSIGNHLTVVAVLPAVVLFTLLTDARATLAPRRLLALTGLALLGLLQYLFIIVRTRMKAPYLEAKATNLTELWGVMTARRFAHEIGAFDWSDFFSTRVPFVSSLIAGELHVIGLVAVAVGFAVLLTRQWRNALLFGLGALGVATLTADMSSEEERGFLLSVFVLLWPLAAVAFEAAATALKKPRYLAAVTACVAAAYVPYELAAANYRWNDHHNETFESDYFDALFETLPNRSAIVDDEYRINMMVLYKLLGERAAGDRNIRFINADAKVVQHFHASGYNVFAFGQSKNALMELGFKFKPFAKGREGAGRETLQSRRIYRLASQFACAQIGNQGWVDLGSVGGGRGRVEARIDNYDAFDARLTIYAGAASREVPVLVGARGNGSPSLRADVYSMSDSDDRTQLARQAGADGLGIPGTIAEYPFIVRADVQVNDGGQYSLFGLDFGSESRVAIARALVDRPSPARATICAHPLSDVDGFAVAHPVKIRADDDDVEFGTGWHDVERRQDGLGYRWTTDRAVLLVPLNHPKRVKAIVDAEALRGSPDPSMRLIVNGSGLESRPLSADRRRLAWSIPDHALRDGLNELVFEVAGARRPLDLATSSDPRLLGASVTEIELAEGETASP